MKNEVKIHEPLFHVIKNDRMTRTKSWIIRGAAVLVALLITGILGMILIKTNPLVIYREIFKGPFVDIWTLLQDTSLLLMFSLAIVPAFKMKYWNMGANGQVLVGCLASIACMKFLTSENYVVLPNWLVIILMIVAGMISSVIFAVIPAVFKAVFNTNETLFTLMMNYIAIGLVNLLVFIWDKSGSGTLGTVNLLNHRAWFPNIGNKYVLSIIVAVLMTVFMFIYMKYTKHGFEASMVGESVNTARYVGINVKKVIIRTLALSGLMCGILGVLYAGSIEHTVNASVGGSGFTGILVAWLADFNPLVMALVSFFVSFLSAGTKYASASLHLGNNNFASISIGLMFFCIIGSEFLIRYRITLTDHGRHVFKTSKKEKAPAEGTEKGGN